MEDVETKQRNKGVEEGKQDAVLASEKDGEAAKEKSDDGKVADTHNDK